MILGVGRVMFLRTRLYNLGWTLRVLAVIASLPALSPFDAQSADLKIEIKRLERCSSLWLKQKIAPSDPLWVAVSLGGVSGTDACMQILDAARLDSSGRIAREGAAYSERGARVLSSFLEFYRGEFVIPEYIKTIDGSIDSTYEVIDANAPAYHFLYSLFSPQEPYSTVVTRSSTIVATRYTQRTTRRTRKILNFFQNINLLMGDDTTDGQASTLTSWTPDLVQTGILVGLQATTPNTTVPTMPRKDNFNAFNGVNVNTHFGGGILGDQATLLANNNKLGPADGGLESYRLWSKNILSDLMCRDLPALRSSDVVTEVNMTSTLPYRQGLSCMGCHSTMDTMAGVLRNLKRVTTAHTQQAGYISVGFFTRTAPTLPSGPYPILKGDPDFHKRPAEGMLWYRSYDGSLVKQSVTGLAELGQRMSESQDLYVCAASRTYRFLTGIQSSLADLTDPLNAPNLTPQQLLVRNRVIQLGLKLKSHQSVRTMIQEIVASPEFVEPEGGPRP